MHTPYKRCGNWPEARYRTQKSLATYAARLRCSLDRNLTFFNPFSTRLKILYKSKYFSDLQPHLFLNNLKMV
jgi:hypothetical protein